MFVTLEVSKLSGWLNADAYCRESKGGRAVRGEVRPGRQEAAGDGGARSVQRRARLQIRGTRARGGAHVEHAPHGCDAGGVEAQRLVERRRGLPRVERRAYGAERGATREVHAACRGELDCRLGARHGYERTRNMYCMVVTLEVSRLSGWLNAAAFCREPKGGHKVRCGERCEGRQARGGGRPRCTQRAGEGSAADMEKGTGRSARGTCSPCS